jgi:virginiamycin B lyase
MTTTVRLTVEALESRDVPSGFPVQTFKIPAGMDFPGNLTVGGDGNVWFTSELSPAVGYVTPAGVAQAFNTSAVSHSGPSGLTRGPDNNMWFVEFWSNKFGKITPTGQITQFAFRQNHGPESIALGPDHRFWVTTFDGTVGRVTPHGKVTWFHPVNGGSNKIVPFHGSLFLKESNAIGRIATSGKLTRTFKMPHHGTLEDLTIGPDHRLWFTEHTGWGIDFLGSMTASGHMREYAIPVGHSNLGQLTAAADGNLYIREADYLLGVNPQGTVFANQYLGFIAGEGSVVQGSDGNVWYAEGVLGRIGVAHVRG